MKSHSVDLFISFSRFTFSYLSPSLWKQTHKCTRKVRVINEICLLVPLFKENVMRKGIMVKTKHSTEDRMKLQTLCEPISEIIPVSVSSRTASGPGLPTDLSKGTGKLCAGFTLDVEAPRRYGNCCASRSLAVYTRSQFLVFLSVCVSASCARSPFRHNWHVCGIST